MEWYFGPEGDQRIWYETDEIECIAEDELHRAGLMATLSNPVTDLERFVEVYLKAGLDQYAALPDGVLGLTQFEAGRRPLVQISSSLTEEAEADPPVPGRVGRWRATIAHEASHVLLHRYLFDPQMAQVFGGRPAGADIAKAGLMRCLHRDVAAVSAAEFTRGRRRQDWREVQANRGMAALLMPSRVFRRVALREMASLGFTTAMSGSAEADAWSAAVADVMDVSRQAALIRLDTLGLLTVSS